MAYKLGIDHKQSTECYDHSYPIVVSNLYYVQNYY